MGMTRRERIKLNKEREKAAKIGGEGLVVKAAPETHCDKCGKSVGTLYRIDGKMICYDDLPFEWAAGRKSYRLIGRAVSGLKAIKEARRAAA